MSNSTDLMEEFYRDLEAENLDALWRREAELLTREPARTGLPHHWSWQRVEPYLQRAGGLLEVGKGGERRVLRLINPSLEAPSSTTHTISATFQLLLPGESAPPHRHSPAALRFIVSGQGAYTKVEGRTIEMNPGDLILTPSWLWHDHGNPTSEPMIWMDVIDTPLILRLKSMFFEPGKRRGEAIPSASSDLTVSSSDPLGSSASSASLGSSSPTHTDSMIPANQLLIRPDKMQQMNRIQGGALPIVYRWSDVEAAFSEGCAEQNPFDGDILYYANPLSGNHHTLPTMGCAVQKLSCGFKTRSHRHLSSTVYLVTRGEGESDIGGETIRWRQGDVLSVPTWTWHSHKAEEDAFLFSISDRPVMEALGWYREEAQSVD